jgi:hypothetical protein
MMSLAEKLQEIREGAKKRVPEHIRAEMTRATSELRSSGIVGNITKTGDLLPGFELPDMDGTMVSSAEMLERGPLVLTFYRGVW